MFKGTSTRTAREIAEVVDSTGGDMNAYTTKEYTAFYLRVPARHLDLGVELLCDVVTAPAFRGPEFESERQVILEELHLQQDEPDDLVHTVLYESLFPEHPLGWEIVGHERSIKAMTPRSVRAFHRALVRPDQHGLRGRGPGRSSALRRPRCAAASVRSPRATRRAGTVRAHRRRRVASCAAPGESAHLSFGWRAVDHFDPDRYPLALVNQVIGGGMSSRLFQTIREDHGLAYSIFSSAASFSDTGVFSIYVGTTPDSTPVVVRHTRDIVDDVVAQRRHRSRARGGEERVRGRHGDEPRGHRVAHGPSRHVGDHPRIGDAARSVSQLGAQGVAARHAARGGEDLRR